MMNFNPVFALTPKLPGKIITGTTTDKSGATDANIQKFSAFSADGAKATRITFKFASTSTAGTFLVWIYDSTIGATLQYEITYPAITSSATVATAGGELVLYDLNLESGQQIWVGATTVNSNIHVRIQYGELGDNV
jgi:hypothetical protein